VKTSIIVQGMIVALISVGVPTLARADEQVVARVPFPFIVGTTELPAGSYVVRADADDGQGIVSIESTDGKRCVYLLTIAATVSRPSGPELAFEKFENRYFLSRVGSGTGPTREIPLTQEVMKGELARVQTVAAPAVTP
jgi:hypothetical protein